LGAYMAAWRARVKPPGSIRLTIDIDPYSFL
jgi:primosomal protein N' (replication factor Y)